MNPLRLARVLARLVVVVVLVTSGIYFVVYLYRWEWNRAQVSGIIFVAAEVTVIGMQVMRRLRALERRSDEAQRAPGPPPPSANPGSPASPEPSADRRPPYPWLATDRTAVFIPVLLGAGAIVAGLAFVVEKVAAFVIGDGDTSVRRLERVAFPAGGLAAETPPAPVHARPTGIRLAALLLTAVSTLAVAVLGLNAVAYYTKSRPSPAKGTGVTEVMLEIGYRIGDEVPPDETARALFESCRLRLPEKSHFASGPTVLADRTVIATIEPALGELGERRLRGCLEDYTLDGVQVDVEVIRIRP